MREETKNLIEQAKKDLEVAEKNFNLEEYYMTAFLCQQCTEKILKAFFIITNGRSAGQTHSLIYLAKETNVPKEFYDFLGSLTPEFITTRYPDVAGDAPYKLYHKEKVQPYIEKTKKLVTWIEKKIEKQQN